MRPMDVNDLGLTAADGSSCRCGGHGSSKRPDPDTTWRTAVLVEGMTCAHCVASVTEEVSLVEGVDRVTVDLGAGGVSTVTIDAQGPVDSAAIAAAIEEAGYQTVAAS